MSIHRSEKNEDACVFKMYMDRLENGLEDCADFLVGLILEKPGNERLTKLHSYFLNDECTKDIAAKTPADGPHLTTILVMFGLEGVNRRVLVSVRKCICLAVLYKLTTRKVVKDRLYTHMKRYCEAVSETMQSPNVQYMAMSAMQLTDNQIFSIVWGIPNFNYRRSNGTPIPSQLRLDDETELAAELSNHFVLITNGMLVDGEANMRIELMVNHKAERLEFSPPLGRTGAVKLTRDDINIWATESPGNYRVHEFTTGSSVEPFINFGTGKEKFNNQDYDEVMAKFKSFLDDSLEGHTIDVASGIYKGKSPSTTKVQGHRMEYNGKAGWVFSMEPAVSHAVKQHILRDMEDCNWTHSSNYSPGHQDRCYRIASSSGKDVFQVGKTRTAYLIPAQSYKNIEITVLKMASWVMKVQRRCLEEHAKKVNKFFRNPDGFNMLQSVIGDARSTSYALHDDAGCLVCHDVPTYNQDPIDEEINQILPSTFEMQVFTLVLGKGDCRVEIGWYKKNGHGQNQEPDAIVVTGENAVHFQGFFVQTGWLHLPRALGSGVRLVISLRWSISSRKWHILKKVLTKEGLWEQYERQVNNCDELYNVIQKNVSGGTEAVHDISGKDDVVEYSSEENEAESTPLELQKQDQPRPEILKHRRQVAVHKSGSKLFCPPVWKNEGHRLFNVMYPPAAFSIGYKTEPWKILSGDTYLRILFSNGIKLCVKTVRNALTVSKRRHKNTGEERVVETYVYPGSPLVLKDGRGQVKAGEWTRESQIRTMFGTTGGREHTPLHCSHITEVGALFPSLSTKNSPMFNIHPQDRPRNSTAFILEHGWNALELINPFRLKNIPISDARVIGRFVDMNLWVAAHGGNAVFEGQNMMAINRANCYSVSGTGSVPHNLSTKENAVLDELYLRQIPFHLFNPLCRKVTPEGREIPDSMLYEGICVLSRRLSEMGSRSKSCLDEEYHRLRKVYGELKYPLAKRSEISFLEQTCTCYEVVPVALYTMGKDVSEPRTITLLVDLRKGAKPDPRVVAIDLTREEFQKHKTGYEFGREEIAAKWAEQKKYLEFLDDKEDERDAVESLCYKGNHMTPDDFLQGMLMVAAGCSYRQQGFANEQNLARPLLPENPPTPEELHRELTGSKDVLPISVPFFVNNEEYLSREQAMARLGFCIRSSSTPHFCRDLDVVCLQSIEDGYCLLHKFEKGKYRAMWPKDVVGSLQMSECKYTGMPKQLLKEGTEEEFLEFQKEVLFGRALLRFTGAVSFIDQFCNDVKVGYGDVEERSRPRLPRKKDAVIYSQYINDHSNKDGRVPFLFSRQHGGSIPIELRETKNIVSFVRALADKVGAISRTIAGMRLWDDVVDALSVFLWDLCQESGCQTTSKSSTDFLSSLIMGDMMSIVLDLFPDNPELAKYRCGPGSTAGLSVFSGTKEEVFDSLLQTVNRASDNELDILGFYRDGNSTVRCKLSNRALTWIDIEHGLCKVYYVTSKTLPSHLTSRKIHLQPQHHPRLHRPYDDAISAIFIASQNSWEIYEGQKFPSSWRHKQDPKVLGSVPCISIADLEESIREEAEQAEKMQNKPIKGVKRKRPSALYSNRAKYMELDTSSRNSSSEDDDVTTEYEDATSRDMVQIVDEFPMVQVFGDFIITGYRFTERGKLGFVVQSRAGIPKKLRQAFQEQDNEQYWSVVYQSSIAVVASVEKGSQAEDCGIQEGDIFVNVYEVLLTQSRLVAPTGTEKALELSAEKTRPLIIYLARDTKFCDES